jgi:GNAT superfamily N-acetyltransferase
LISLVQAVKGDGTMLKNHLPFICPDVNYIERMLATSEAIVFFAEDMGVPVGAVGGWLKGTPSGYEEEDKVLRQHNAYDEAHLCWIAVKKEFRHKKIGTTMIQKICEWALERGKKKIWTEISTKRDPFEIPMVFYKKLGFKKIGEFVDAKGERYVTMLKELGT